MEPVDDWDRLTRAYLAEGARLTEARSAAGAALYPAWFDAGLGGVWALANVVRLLDDCTPSAGERPSRG